MPTAMMLTPKRIMDRITESAMSCWFIMDSGRRNTPKPGQFLLGTTTPEEREILKYLTGEDLQNTHRPSLFWDIKPYERR